MLESIFHISVQGLLDWRIEKSTLSAKQDHKVYFAGLVMNRTSTIFDRTYLLEWDYKARYYYPNEWRALKRQLI